MLEKIERFDMQKPPITQRWFLKHIIWALALPDVRKHKTVITYTRCEGLKPPYILLGNHNSFYDFKVATKAIFPHGANYVIAIDGFIGREWLLRNVGGICKRKFTSSVQLIRNIKQVIENGQVLVLYPEARYSLCGTTAVLPDSLGKLCKMMDVPVVTLITHGHHIDSPFWNLKKRGCKGTTAELKQLFTVDELRRASKDEVNAAIRKEFVYDEYAWQKSKRIAINVPWRAEGLHKVLYKCLSCGREYRMDSKGDKLYCRACGKAWRMSELGELSAEKGATEFSHIPDWYEWERAQVRQEIENGSYYFEASCHVDSLPNAKKFIPMGNGVIRHDMTGFHLSGSGDNGDFTMDIPAAAMYSCHIEYNYLGKHGDCIDLNTLTDTCYIYPHGEDFSVTKLALATEELFCFIRNRRDGSDQHQEDKVVSSDHLSKELV